jgi:hypothetical protein
MAQTLAGRRATAAVVAVHGPIAVHRSMLCLGACSTATDQQQHKHKLVSLVTACMQSLYCTVAGVQRLARLLCCFELPSLHHVCPARQL